MRQLASFIMQSRLRAVTATVGFGVIGLLIPPLALLSSAAVALVTLRVGPQQALAVVVLAAVVVGLIGWIAGLSPVVGLVTALVQWIPALALAAVLRSTVSWAVTLVTGIVIGCGVVLMLHLSVPDITQMWYTVLQQTVGPLFDQSGMSTLEREEAFRQAAAVMTGMLAAVSLLALSLSLVLARYWQSVLYNPGGFAQEFQQLSMGRVPAILLLVLLVLGLFAGMTLMFELSLVFLAAFFLHGLAVIHGINRKLNLSRLWLVMTYVVMAFALPQMMVVLATLGMVDSFVDLRGRIAHAGNDSP
ncbi:DUF2232 domain-containing protein [Ectothiorhodospira lacustris]|uniref:DUF2232 domain-containing protein n=2 Tax=Ectothiorhodospira lacustris TaxID=2899127 RepID=UPI001EE79283|nr:DUF2232 domain-containing protein [Ectothiorhodospira lacustris]